MDIEFEAFIIANYVAALSSFLACILLFWVYSRNTLNPITSKYIFMIGFYDFIGAIINILAPLIPGNTWTCSFVEMIINISIWGSLLWSTAIALVSYHCLNNPQEFDNDTFFFRAKFWIPGLSIGTSLLPVFGFFVISYSSLNNEFCGYSPAGSGWISAFQILPIFPPILITVFVYYHEIKLLQQISSIPLHKTSINIGRLLLYPIIQWIVYTPHIIFVLILNNSSANGQGFFEFLFFVIFRLAGLINTIVFLGRRPTKKSKYTTTQISQSFKNSRMYNPEISDMSVYHERALEKALEAEIWVIQFDSHNPSDDYLNQSMSPDLTGIN
jgi:hypothetical protein